MRTIRQHDEANEAAIADGERRYAESYEEADELMEDVHERCWDAEGRDVWYHSYIDSKYGIHIELLP